MSISMTADIHNSMAKRLLSCTKGNDNIHDLVHDRCDLMGGTEDDIMRSDYWPDCMQQDGLSYRHPMTTY
ncbi:Hypothetical predicted protein [Octopus vulgaris]|uniref:Uncharacterized protein n=1 Tax=Octopus vulgaris TaxID=6645 RepID=A0AA36ALJ7_OCTVU|nr:Hypothetical predicted protein [Octopus vulgaris]